MGQTFYFQWEVGGEGLLLESLVELVKRPDSAFDWFDAAIVSNRISQTISDDLKPFIAKP